MMLRRFLNVLVALITLNITCAARANAGASVASAPVLPAELMGEFVKSWPKNRTINLVFHGHSVPSGYHKTPDVRPFESYPHLVYRALKERYPYAVINVITTTVGGEESEKGAARFEADVFGHRPDVIFIDYGLNDRRLPEARVKAAWTSMITSAKTRGIPVVLLTPTGAKDVNYDDPKEKLTVRANIIRTLGIEQSVPVVDVYASWSAKLKAGTDQATLLSQVNHPSLEGHQIAAAAIMALFDQSRFAANAAKVPTP